MPSKVFDRMDQNVGNIWALEHINLTVPDQRLATIFYVLGLGLTRDPYFSVGDQNMWINVGLQQFHLPTRPAQVLRGHIGLAFPDLTDLFKRLQQVADSLKDTAFQFTWEEGYLRVSGPWGNQFRCYQTDPSIARISLGISYIELEVPRGSSEGISRFYTEVMDSPTTHWGTSEGVGIQIAIGTDQRIIFKETDDIIPEYDGHHIAMYVANFSKPHTYLEEHGLVTEETNDYQYRFKEITDPLSGASLFALEHEVRSLRHPMYQRELVNRNTSQSFGQYTRGGDQFNPLT